MALVVATAAPAFAQGERISPVDLIRSSDPDERQRGLAEMAGADDVDAMLIVSLLESDPSLLVRRRAAITLGTSDSPKAAEALRGCVGGAAPETVKRACRAGLATAAARKPEPLSLVPRRPQPEAKEAVEEQARPERPSKERFGPIAVLMSPVDYFLFHGLGAGVELPVLPIRGTTAFIGLTAAWTSAAIADVKVGSQWFALDLEPHFYLGGKRLRGPYLAPKLVGGRISVDVSGGAMGATSASAYIYGGGIHGGWSWVPVPDLVVKVGLGIDLVGNSIEGKAAGLEYDGFEPTVDVKLGFVF